MYMYNYHFFSGMVSHFNILSGQYSSTCRMLTAFYIFIYFIYLSLLERMSLQRWCHVNSVSLYAEAMHYSVKKTKILINTHAHFIHVHVHKMTQANMYMHTCNFIHVHKWWAYVYMYMTVYLPNIVKMRNTHE